MTQNSSLIQFQGFDIETKSSWLICRDTLNEAVDRMRYLKLIVAKKLMEVSELPRIRQCYQSTPISNLCAKTRTSVWPLITSRTEIDEILPR